MVKATLCIFSKQPSLAAQSIAPDNTSSIETKTAVNSILATVQRDSLGSLRSTIDDLLVNLHVAVKIIEQTQNYLQTYPTPEKYNRIL